MHRVLLQNGWAGAKAKFRYVQCRDIPDLCRLFAKKVVCKWLPFGPNSREETRRYFTPMVESIDGALENCAVPEYHLFALTHPDTDGFVGLGSIRPVEHSPGSYMLDFQIDDQWWRQGYGTELCRFLVFFGFSRLGAYRLCSATMAGNSGSRRVLQKCGFSQEGRQHKFWHVRGDFQDRILYGLLKEDLEGERLRRLISGYQVS
ncbi:MAG: GNAT family N-acetyltransferase [Methanomicrobiaceae archaeon]|nr:GNAT family N-acetyltransferase [Methanomicrobiaceae archaeon]